MEAGHGWRFALRPCIGPVVRWVSGLLHLLFDVAMCGLVALGIAMADWIVLVALAIVIPLVFGTSSRVP
jgi:hypothetical protein